MQGIWSTNSAVGMAATSLFILFSRELPFFLVGVWEKEQENVENLGKCGPHKTVLSLDVTGFFMLCALRPALPHGGWDLICG